MNRLWTMILLLAASMPLAAQPMTHLATLNPDVSSWGWPEQPHHAGPSFSFGYSLDTDGPLLIVGMPGAKPHVRSPTTGALALYRRSGDDWLLESLLTPPADSLLHLSGCGFSAGILDGGDYSARLFGCPFADSPSLEESGRATLSAVLSSGETTSVRNPTGEGDGSRMGLSVSITRAPIDGTVWAAIGVPGSELSWSPHSEGRVEIWRLEDRTWYLEATLMASDGEPGDRFGHSVSISAQQPWAQLVRVAVGAPFHDGWRGAVYVFERNQGTATWSEVAKRMAPAADIHDKLGWSVAHHTTSPAEGLESLLVAGAKERRPGGDPTQWNRGTVSVWRQSSASGYWNYAYEGEIGFFCFGASEICEGQSQAMEFGWSVAIDSGVIWIGAPEFATLEGSNVGRVYKASFKPTLEAWTIDDVITPGPLSSDCGQFSVAQSGGRFGNALAVVPGGVAVGYPSRGCHLLTMPPGPRWGQVRIFGVSDIIHADRFD